ncbi:hypothetical protein LZ24_02540 [Desulfobotulus alkaliphilus]|uniref:Uncharacterized protein n=1 Tax=Desulfobotulus alkaliphilus TaxID=622671 RepID=A0A562RHI7_9BACT|nr:hypothetical protein [Desulfobotulus alkaliphilus]TWI68567.1 hypothetical protein LZ24_02540 [Desulfobotulus alkaliphilus]
MGHKYNIPPLALGHDVWVKAELMGLVLPPLKRTGTDPGGDTALPCGHFRMTARLSGQPRSFARHAGRFSVQPVLSGSPSGLMIMLSCGRFTAAAGITGPGLLHGYPVQAGVLSPVCRLSGRWEHIVWWLKHRARSAQRVFVCVITGTANGLEDLEIPISSLQYRLYGHGGSYLSVVIPNAVQNTAAITARKGGQIVLYQGIRYADGSRDLAEMARAGKINIRHDTGGRNSSVTLTAGERLSFSFDPAIPKRSGPLISTALQADGQTRIRCAPVFGLFPGDTVQTPQGNYVAERISVSVGRNQATMEILTA